MKRLTLWLLLCVALPLVFDPASAQTPPPVQITHESSWYFQGQPCGTKAQCKALATTAAQANPGVVQQVFPAPFDVIASTSDAGPCTNIGAMQPGDYYDANGNPVFADPCHAHQ